MAKSNPAKPRTRPNLIEELRAAGLLTSKQSTEDFLKIIQHELSTREIQEAYLAPTGEASLAFFKDFVIPKAWTNELGQIHLDTAFQMNAPTALPLQLFLRPREHLKTTQITVGESTRLAIANPNLRFLLTHARHKKALTFLRGVKGILLKQRTIDVFGRLIPEDRYRADNTEELTLSTRFDLSIREPTFATGGVDKEEQTGHFDWIVADDLVVDKNSRDGEQLEKTYHYFQALFDLLDKRTGHLRGVGCILGGTPVLMHDGTWKPIEQVQAGERVVSHDGVRRVTAMIPQGAAETFTVKTGNHTVTATANHPFLTPDGWKRVDELKIGDRIMAAGEFGDAVPVADDEDWFVLGFMFGDGWVTHMKNQKTRQGKPGWIQRWQTVFAKSPDVALNRRVIDWFQSRLNETLRDKGGVAYRSCKPRVGRYFQALGLTGKAKTKRVPDYVFRLSLRERKAFLAGFAAADGHTSKSGRVKVEIANAELLHDLKLLAMACGYRTSNMTSRTRLSHPPGSPKPILATSHHFAWSAAAYNDPYFYLPVKSIEPAGIQQVFDISVQASHSFIADGLVVHNTWHHPVDCWGRIMDELCDLRCREAGWQHVPDCDCEFDVFFSTLKDSEGNYVYKARFNEKMERRLRRIKGPREFARMYDNNPFDPASLYLTAAQVKGCKVSHKHVGELLRTGMLIIIQIVDPAESKKKKSAFTAIVTVGIHKETGVWFVLWAEKARVETSDFLEMVFAQHRMWKPHLFGMENNTRKALKWALEQEMLRQKYYFDINELAPNFNDGPDDKKRRFKQLVVPLFNHGAAFVDETAIEVIQFLETAPNAKYWDVGDCLSYVPALAPHVEGMTHEEEQASRHDHEECFESTGY